MMTWASLHWLIAGYCIGALFEVMEKKQSGWIVFYSLLGLFNFAFAWLGV